MKTLLYLDDQRNPFFELPKEIRDDFKIVWVRNGMEFMTYIMENGLPYVLDFDHDLALEHYTPKYFWENYNESKRYQDFVKKDYQELTGEKCAEWVKETWHEVDIPVYVIHSANPVGADWIREHLPKKKETTYEGLIKKMSNNY